MVWIATRKAAEDLERSCDEIVTEGMERSERQAYAQLLLDTAAPGRGCTTCLSAAAGTLRYRLKGVMDQRRRLLGTVLVMASLFACVMCFGTVSLSDARGSFSSLVLTPDVGIVKMYDPQYSDLGDAWDDTALREELDKIKLEHITGLRSPVIDDKMTILLSDGRFASLSDEVLIIHDYHHYNIVADCYLIKSSVNWDALRACCQ